MKVGRSMNAISVAPSLSGLRIRGGHMISRRYMAAMNVSYVWQQISRRVGPFMAEV